MVMLLTAESLVTDPEEKQSGKRSVTHVTEVPRMQQGLFVHSSYMEEIKTFA